MKKLGYDLELMIAQLSGDDERARVNLRARQVRDRYKQAIEKVYRDQATLFLAHTNNAYIMNKDGVRTLIVYVDESIFAAELNAQRELIKLKLLELFGEDIEQFEIYVSRGDYKKNHPYLASAEEAAKPLVVKPLDDETRKQVFETASIVEDERLRTALQNAMTADFQLKKAENDQYHEK